MTTEELKERNLEIAKMLGFKFKNQAKYWMRYPFKDNSVFGKLNYIMSSNLQFDSDWRRLMQAVDFIERIGKVGDRSNKYDVKISLFVTCIATVNQEIVWIKADSKIESTFKAVSDFAKLYNNGL